MVATWLDITVQALMATSQIIGPPKGILTLIRGKKEHERTAASMAVQTPQQHIRGVHRAVQRMSAAATMHMERINPVDI